MGASAPNVCVMCAAFLAQVPATQRCRGCGGLYCDACAPRADHPDDERCLEGMEPLLKEVTCG